MSWRLWMFGIGLSLSSAVAFSQAADKPAKKTPPVEKSSEKPSEKPAEDLPAAEDDSPIVATVNGKPIRAAEVQDALAPALAGRKIPTQAIPQLQAEAASRS